MNDAPKKTDRYRDTVFLPTTEFPMRAGLPEREPQILKRWEDMNLYGLLRQQSHGRTKFVLHDGPPYANGNIHIGHALNKTLKDLVVGVTNNLQVFIDESLMNRSGDRVKYYCCFPAGPCGKIIKNTL